MSVIDKLAASLGRKDDKPNQDLAKELAEKEDTKAIEELLENLNHKDPKIASNCIKVLYEIGYIKPELIKDFANEFIDLLTSKNNRLVWGGMIAVQTITSLSPKKIWKRRGEIINAFEKDSVITQDRAIMSLAELSSIDKEYEKRLFPIILDYLDNCRAKSFPQYAESVFIAINKGNKDEYLRILESRLSNLEGTRKKRIEKLIKKVGAI